MGRRALYPTAEEKKAMSRARNQRYQENKKGLKALQSASSDPNSASKLSPQPCTSLPSNQNLYEADDVHENSVPGERFYETVDFTDMTNRKCDAELQWKRAKWY